ncbi:hypothetical protein L1987_34736 [Smallanthus sonchifolius]|uniref:Uncharacterized protein n=1 Tax=Smallanthus sonchifolius TaxID=185202 RepID=A0ACB9HVH7_9ASTR|nr:hypothetical protein L1987_34736 [Smallanthus sonchifolius]
MYETVVKLRMDGLPIVLREEKTYREIAELYGKVEHLWPPVLKEPAIPAMVGEKGGEEAKMMDLEEGEIRPVVTQNMEAADFPVTGQPENQGEVETNRHVGEVGDKHTLHGEKRAAHVWVDSHCTPRKPRATDDGVNGGPDQIRPSVQMGLPSGASSRKRPRNFIRPNSLNSPSGPSQNHVFGKNSDIPPFPDLNNPVTFYTGSSVDIPSLGFAQPDDDMGVDSCTFFPETQLGSAFVAIENEVANTIDVGIYVEAFVDQVRLLIEGNKIGRPN